MTDHSTEDLRSLLRSADLARDNNNNNNGGNTSIDKELGDLVSMIGAIDAEHGSKKPAATYANDNFDVRRNNSFFASKYSWI